MLLVGAVMTIMKRISYCDPLKPLLRCHQFGCKRIEQYFG
jgi:hypothetical protein